MDISIIGGGITGLTTALALNKLGYSSTVFERSNQLNEIGAGLLLQPNALKVLDWLGIRNEVSNAGYEITNMEITDRNLKPFRKVSTETISDHEGNLSLAIHRTELQKILATAVNKIEPIVYDAKYVRHEDNDGKVKVTLEKSNFETDILLGCDGIYSQVRKTIFPDATLRTSHQICWRGISAYKMPAELQRKSKEMWGKRIRFGFAQLSPELVYWFAVKSRSDRDRNLNKEQVSQLFKNFTPMVGEIITATDYIHEDELSDLSRLNTWSHENVCLLGDAAHATTPNMGQGACQGIEDAYYFANMYARNRQYSDAFSQFESSRRKKVDYVVNTSWMLGKIAHLGMGSVLMKGISALTPNSLLQKQIKQLYQIDSF